MMWHTRLGLLLCCLLAAVPGKNALADEQPAPAAITVEGSGEVASAPDMAVVIAGVVATRRTATEAIDESNTAIGNVLSVASDSGVADKDLRTVGFSVTPRYDRENPGKVTGYSVTNRVQIRFREIDKLGTLLDGLIRAGSNRIDSVTFGLEDTSPAKQEARRRAMQDARRRAELYAEEAGGRLGTVISVDEQIHVAPAPRVAMAMDAEALAAPSAVPLALGEHVTQVSVVVKFQLLY